MSLMWKQRWANTNPFHISTHFFNIPLLLQEEVLAMQNPSRRETHRTDRGWGTLLSRSKVHCSKASPLWLSPLGCDFLKDKALGTYFLLPFSGVRVTNSLRLCQYHQKGKKAAEIAHTGLPAAFSCFKPEPVHYQKQRTQDIFELKKRY